MKKIPEQGFYDPRMITGEPHPPKTEKQKAQEAKERAKEKADAEPCLRCTAPECNRGTCARFPACGSIWHMNKKRKKNGC